MALAAYTDANAWLDGTRISFTDDTDAAPEAANAEAVIKGKLFGAYPDLIDSWTATAAPAIVKTTAAMLMASYRYARKYSAESVRANGYAVWLEKEAMKYLDDIAAGVILLFDVTPLPSGDVFTENDFYPNDTTGALNCDETDVTGTFNCDEDVKFTMGDRY